MHIHTRRCAVVLVVLVLLFSCICGVCSSAFAAEAQKGIVYGLDVGGALNVRETAGLGSGSKVIGKLQNGDEVTIQGTVSADDIKWYKIKTADGKLAGYASSEYIRIQVEYKPDANFEAYLTAQKFPESYKEALRNLHAQYPNWVFVAQHLNKTWSEALAAEAAVGRSLVHSSAKASWKSMEYGAYDWNKKAYVAFDSGGWVSAQQEVVAYYMDPRNFLDETSVFQFESLSYSTVHTVDGVKKILSGSFLEPLAADFVEAAKSTGVSAYHLASRALQEQGKSGNALGTGTTPGYTGYYNIFDIGAYAANGLSAIQNGAQYAKSKGWDTPQKSIVGGASQLGKGYITKGQDTLYLQKFDVVDGGNGFYNHQYMTNVSAAASEAKLMKLAYTADMLSGALVFNIPVYAGMPSAPCVCPTSDGNNDNTLTALSVNGYSLIPTFSRYTTQYEVNLPAVIMNTEAGTTTASGTSAGTTATKSTTSSTNVSTSVITSVTTSKQTTGSTVAVAARVAPGGTTTTKSGSTAALTTSAATTTTTQSKDTTVLGVKVNIKAVASDKNAVITGAGEITLSAVDTAVNIQVKAPSGLVRTYTVHIHCPGADGSPVINDTKYTLGTYVTGVAPDTTAVTLLKELAVENATAQVVDADGAAVTGKLVTGHTLQIIVGGKVFSSYPIVIYGDVSGDGAVSSRDLLMAQKHILGITKLEGAPLAAADSGKDGKLTSSDLLRTQKQILGISSPIL